MLPGTPMPAGASLATLRGIEGQKVKSAYAHQAKLHSVKGFKRVSRGAEDPVNVGLNLGNSILYGLAATVCSALSLNPALGFIHEGHTGALLFDLADVYKCDVTIPAAFAAAGSGKLVEEVSRTVRSEIHRRRLLQAMFSLTQGILKDGLNDSLEADTLLGDGDTRVPGHTNWHLA
jgi:CRISPR-associated protein Cas1